MGFIAGPFAFLLAVFVLLWILKVLIAAIAAGGFGLFIFLFGGALFLFILVSLFIK